MPATAAQGSPLPGGFVLGKLVQAERVGLVYEALPGDGNGFRARALVLHPQHAEALQAWFEDYARLLRGLSHPNLLYVHAIGYVDSGLPVVVTEWVDGRTLRSELARGHIFQPAEILRILRPLASALDYLHSKAHPILHRALQPEMVMLCGPELTVKLLGVGEANRPLMPPLRPQYLSPEELDGPGPTTASDLFCLASLTYELITGRVAFPGPPAALLQAVRKGPRPFLALGPHEALAPVDAVLHRTWEADPALRPPSAISFFAALAAAMEQVPAAELVRRRTPLDSPLRARTLSGAPMSPSGQKPRSLPPGVQAVHATPSQASRSGAHSALRAPSAPMGWATNPQGPASARSGPPRSAPPGAMRPSPSSAPPGRGHDSDLRLPRAPRPLSLEPGTPTGPSDLPPPRPPSVRPAAMERHPAPIETDDAEISLSHVVDIHDREITDAVLDDVSLPLPDPETLTLPHEHDDDERPTLEHKAADGPAPGLLTLATAPRADATGPRPAMPRTAALPGTERSSWEDWSPAGRSGPQSPRPNAAAPAPAQLPAPAPSGPREIRLTSTQLALLIAVQALLTLLALALVKWG
jgi:serine/threonine protein kinase